MIKQVSNEQVADMLAECLVGQPNFISPDEDQVEYVTKRINYLLTHPWTDLEIADLREAAKVQRAEGQILRDAADLLDRERETIVKTIENYEIRSMMRTALDHRLQALNSAITLLRELRGPLDTPGLTVHLNTGPKGRNPAPWRLTAAAIGDEVIRTLRQSGDRCAGIGSLNGPVVRFISKCLELMFPDDETPKNSTIHEALTIHLAQSLEYQAKGV